MSSTEKAQDALIEKLEEFDWDFSEENLDEIAEELKSFFASLEKAREFVESNASSLYDLMMERGSDTFWKKNR